jgi:hypothetical protein
LGIIILFHLLISFYFISKQHITYDEPSYIEYSKRWLLGNPERTEPLDDSKTPVISIVWLPRIVQQLIQPNLQHTDFGKTDQQQGRYMMVCFSILLLIYIYCFLKKLNIQNWLLIFFFLIIDPLIIAYSVLINSDLLSGLVLLATIYHLHQYINCKKTNHLFFSSLWLATGLVTKHSFIFFLPIFWLILFFHKKKMDWKLFFTTSLIIIFTINCWFYFHNSFVPLKQYFFLSTSFKTIQQNLSFIGWLPIPLPYTYLQSLDMLQYHAQLGGSSTNTYPGVYILGNFTLNGNFWYYYIVALFFKFPISILIFISTGIILSIKYFKKIFATYWIIIIPILFYLFILSFLNKFQIGIRHLLIILPLVYILIAVLINKIYQTKYKWCIAVLWLYMFISVVQFYPDIIPYTNELVSNKSKVYEKLMDTSMDYGQSKLNAYLFLQKNKNYTYPTNTPTTGKFIVSMQEMVLHKMNNDTTFNWLIKNYKPTKVLNNVYLLFNVEKLP